MRVTIQYAYPEKGLEMVESIHPKLSRKLLISRHLKSTVQPMQYPSKMELVNLLAWALLISTIGEWLP